MACLRCKIQRALCGSWGASVRPRRKLHGQGLSPAWYCGSCANGDGDASVSTLFRSPAPTSPPGLLQLLRAAAAVAASDCGRGHQKSHLTFPVANTPALPIQEVSSTPAAMFTSLGLDPIQKACRAILSFNFHLTAWLRGFSGTAAIAGLDQTDIAVPLLHRLPCGSKRWNVHKRSAVVCFWPPCLQPRLQSSSHPSSRRTAAALVPLCCCRHTMPRQAAITLCIAAVVLQLLLPAQAHMVMIEPKSRQWLDYTLRYNYNPHAVNGGGEQGGSRVKHTFGNSGTSSRPLVGGAAAVRLAPALPLAAHAHTAPVEPAA